jgi:heme/copper-type cytochrome/quinol oxidase subunit 1
LIPALILVLGSFFIDTGSGTSWTLYPPLSSEGHSSVSVDLLILGLHSAGIRSLLGRINFLVTIKILHSPTITLRTARLFIWCIGVTVFLLLLSLPVLAGALTIVIFDRHMNTSFFSPSGGGNRLIYQHLF